MKNRLRISVRCEARAELGGQFILDMGRIGRTANVFFHNVTPIDKLLFAKISNLLLGIAVMTVQEVMNNRHNQPG